MNSKLPTASLLPSFRRLAVCGPGLLVMLADTDAGNVVSAAQAGASWGYRLLPLLLLLMIPLYLIQELTVRLGIHSKRGHGELIREHFGRGWAWASIAGLGVAVAGSLVTEFTAVAGIGEMAGLPRALTLPAAALALVAIITTGSYRRIARTALVIGLFELAFFAVAWAAHPDWRMIAADTADMPFSNREFIYLMAALIGAVFNPWMVFYQQAAVVDKHLGPEHLRAARIDTAAGAVITQCLTAAVLITAAAILGGNGDRHSALDSVGEISRALAPVLGAPLARIVFGAGVLGAAMVAGYRHSLEFRPRLGPWFYGVYALAVAGSATLVGFARDLVWLNIGAQAVNALLLPLVLGLLVALAARALPREAGVTGAYKWALATTTCAVCALGWVGAAAGWIGST
ncbi:divalent metal cation transporter [Paraburkholderia sp. A2RI-6]|uniref:NRAMP family divalent metal transporter n=1 Tax=Paraburkholderia sp. A2RI-6 TaxID=3028371 RepID=UPI003B7B1676